MTAPTAPQAPAAPDFEAWWYAQYSRDGLTRREVAESAWDAALASSEAERSALAKRVGELERMLASVYEEYADCRKTLVDRTTDLVQAERASAMSHKPTSPRASAN